MPSSPKSPKDEDNFLPTSISNRSSFGLSTGASSSSLAQYYIPDKITSSPSYWGSEARTASRKAAGGWGAAAGPRRTSQGSASALNVRESYRGNGVLFNPAYQETSGSSSAIYTLNNPHSTRSSLLIGPPSSGHRNRKWGAGRDAWGQDGGGNPALGAGGFEDDDGLDLTQDRYGREQRHPLGAEAAPASTITGNSPPASELMPSLMAAPTSITGKRIRWNRFKWTLVAANSLVSWFHSSLLATYCLLSSLFLAHNLFRHWLRRRHTFLDRDVQGNKSARYYQSHRNDLWVIIVDLRGEQERLLIVFFLTISGLDSHDHLPLCLHHWLGWDFTQQSIISSRLYFFTLDCFHLHRCTWLHSLQVKNI